MGCLEVFSAAGVWVERQLKYVRLSLGASIRVKFCSFTNFSIWESSILFLGTYRQFSVDQVFISSSEDSWSLRQLVKARKLMKNFV